ncbi:MAG: penicillin-binding transpeptidase domain-containing protein, partial [candidate division Zixibacteria bacterium]|nr:penicillin-binding transpeptidase domain-containing protein [candidate division Zixibacteria bacterium]
LRAMLRGVVERGTAEVVNSPAITIAGKTGTAQIPDAANKRYFQNKFVGSFAGFFPCEKPMIAGVVVLTEAHPVHYGGYTAGPAFRKIAERYAILQPGLLTDPERMLVENTGGKKEMVEVPDVVGRTVATAREIVEERHLTLRCDTEQGQIVWQFPRADGLLFEGDELLVMVARPDEEDKKMANLTGLSIREVSAFLRFMGIKFRVQGNGRVVRQSIRPGEIISTESVCRLECRPI